MGIQRRQPLLQLSRVLFHAVLYRLGAAGEPPALQAVRDSIARDSTRLEGVKQSLQSGTDAATGRAIPASQKPLLQQRQATLESRVNDLRARRQRLMVPLNVPTITFEFLNAQGQVVSSETIAAQTIEPNGTKQFQLTPTGRRHRGVAV